MAKETPKEKAKKPAKAAKLPVKKKEVRKKPSIPETKFEAKPEMVAAKPEEVIVNAVPEASIPVVREKVVHKPKEDEVYYSGCGRRKTAIATVRLYPGSGNIMINDRSLSDYVAGRKVLEIMVKAPLEVAGLQTKYDVRAVAHGGGVVGQAGAVSLGIARALMEASPELRAKLKPAGLVRRDPRMKERKKYGRKKARKRFQYSKR